MTKKELDPRHRAELQKLVEPMAGELRTVESVERSLNQIDTLRAALSEFFAALEEGELIVRQDGAVVVTDEMIETFGLEREQ